MFGGSFKLWIFEAFLCAICLIGTTDQSGVWFFIYWAASAVFLAIPVIGGAVGILISLVLASGVSSFFNDRIIGWYIGIILFIVLVVFNSFISIYGHTLFGFSIVIFEAFIIAGTINMSTNQIILPVIVFVVLIVLAFAPLIRLFEYIILSIVALIELYYVVARSVPAPHTYILLFLIFALMGYFFFVVYFLIDDTDIIKTGKKNRIIKKINKVLPQLEESGTEYHKILIRCNNKEETESFKSDWDNYKLSLWKAIKSKKDKPITKAPFSFEEWYEANNRWKYTFYYHAYYSKQLSEERYIEKETERIRMLWVCDYCGRINKKEHYQCVSCGALQKLVIPEQK